MILFFLGISIFSRFLTVVLRLQDTLALLIIRPPPFSNPGFASSVWFPEDSLGGECRASAGVCALDHFPGAALIKRPSPRFSLHFTSVYASCISPRVPLHHCSPSDVKVRSTCRAKAGAPCMFIQLGSIVQMERRPQRQQHPPVFSGVCCRL